MHFDSVYVTYPAVQTCTGDTLILVSSADGSPTAYRSPRAVSKAPRGEFLTSPAQPSLYQFREQHARQGFGFRCKHAKQRRFLV
jgi:hypothetical protein